MKAAGGPSMKEDHKMPVRKKRPTKEGKRVTIRGILDKKGQALVDLEVFSLLGACTRIANQRGIRKEKFPQGTSLMAGAGKTKRRI